jgi:predicted N-acetyltransferase YhbS
MRIRPVTTADAENVGRIMYKAFCGIADRHNFPCDFPTLEAAMRMAAMCAENPSVTGFVAENGNGDFLGSNFLWRHNSIAGVGPITVDPEAQAQGVGKSLMRAVIEAGKDAPGIRLVQDSFNTASMPLYAGLGFEVVEPLVIMQGVPAGGNSMLPGTKVRPIAEKDLAACGELCEKVHGFDRTNELRETAKIFPSFFAERENRIVAYAAAPNFWQLNHAVAENAEDMRNLLAGAAKITKQPLAFLLPTRQSELFRWCLAQKLRVIKPMTLMAMGEYQKPCGAFLPSVLY